MVLPNHNSQKNEKSELRKVVEHKAKKQARKTGRKLAKKLAKKVGQAASKTVMKTGTLILKFLGAVVGLLSIPVGLMIIFAVSIILLVSLVASFLFSSGEDLEGVEKELHNYIVEQANSSVDLHDPIQLKYRLPEELIASVIQIDLMEGKDEKEVVKDMAEALSPEFYYEEFNEWVETQTQVCKNDDCEPWSEIQREDNFVQKITNIDYWKGNTLYTYTPYTTEWETTVEYEKEIEEYVVYEELSEKLEIEVPYTDYEYQPVETIKIVKDKVIIPDPPYVVWVDREVVVITWELVEVTKYKTVTEVITKQVPKTETRENEIKTITKTRHQRFLSEERSTEDYSMLDSVLNSYDFGLTDKRLMEVNYLFVDGEINYTNWLETNFTSPFSNINFSGTIIPGESIPTEYMEYYLGAQEKYGVDWYTLAAIHFVETAFGTHPTMISSAGAIGPMQFMPATWAGQIYNNGYGLVDDSIDITSLSVIEEGKGYGVDGNGDGKADPWNDADSIYSAANYLSSSGYQEDPRKAVYSYNHADWYVDKVLTTAQLYQSEAVYKPDGDVPPITPGMFMRPATGSITSGYGPRWGSKHTGIDIGKNGRTHDVPIVAAADGVVIRSKYSTGDYGNYILIRHQIDGHQYETLYAHMQSRVVEEGTTVMKGQLIGYMGNTGRSTGPHLHFEIEVPEWNPSRSYSIDPTFYIPF